MIIYTKKFNKDYIESVARKWCDFLKNNRNQELTKLKIRELAKKEGVPYYTVIPEALIKRNKGIVFVGFRKNIRSNNDVRFYKIDPQNVNFSIFNEIIKEYRKEYLKKTGKYRLGQKIVSKKRANDVMADIHYKSGEIKQVISDCYDEVKTMWREFVEEQGSKINSTETKCLKDIMFRMEIAMFPKNYGSRYSVQAEAIIESFRNLLKNDCGGAVFHPNDELTVYTEKALVEELRHRGLDVKVTKTIEL